MSAEELPVKSEFQIMDDADSKQIEEADTAVKQALVYESNGKRQLSYVGIKWLVLKMSQKDQPLEIPDLPCVELVKHDEDNQHTWVWYATVKVRNSKTGLESIGASEQPFLDKYRNYEYDSFGRTKAISKAERNAFRKQIPELEIEAMMNQVNPEDIQQLNNNGTQHTTPGPLNEDYVKRAELLGIDVSDVKSNFQLKKLIDEAEKNAKEAKPAETKSENTDDDYEKYCICGEGKFVPGSVNANFCANCKKMKPEEAP